MRMATMATMAAMAGALASPRAEAQARAPSPMDPSVVFRAVGDVADAVASMVFRQTDADRDGRLTRAEAVAAGARLGIPMGADPAAWAAFDLNRDGVVVEREFADAIRAVHARTAQGLRPF